MRDQAFRLSQDADCSTAELRCQGPASADEAPSLFTASSLADDWPTWGWKGLMPYEPSISFLKFLAHLHDI